MNASREAFSGAVSRGTVLLDGEAYGLSAFEEVRDPGVIWIHRLAQCVDSLRHAPFFFFDDSSVNAIERGI